MNLDRSTAREFLDLLGRAREERGLSYEQLAKRTGIDRATLHRWFTKRITLPSWDEVAPIVRVVDGEHEAEWLGRWRRASDHGHHSRPPAPVLPPTPADGTRTDNSHGIDRGRLIAIAVSAVVVMISAVWVTQRTASRASDAVPPPPDVFTGLPARDSGTTAWSADRGAHAEFDPHGRSLLLFDDRTDGRSAILIMSADGQRIGPVYNSSGKTGRLKEGRAIPPQSIEIDTLNGRIDFRICTGERRKPIPLDSCGPWTRLPAP